MHMADALLSPTVGGLMYGASISAIAYASHKMKSEDLLEKKLPLMAVAGAFVFAAQMINFTIPGTGSSGHLGGGMLLAGLLGGFPALLAISCVLIIQCLFFADGGLLALGANIFNMGVIPCLLVYPLIFRPMLQKDFSRKRVIVSSIVASILSLQLGALGVVLQTFASGVTSLPLSAFIIAMQPIHLAIGVVEGIVTAAVLNFVFQARPEILENLYSNKSLSAQFSIKKIVIAFAVLSLFIGGGLSLYVSENPDGLEWSIEKVAGTAELENDGRTHALASEVQEKTSFMPDYDFTSGEGNGTSVAGLIGAAMTFALSCVLGLIISIVKRIRFSAEVKRE